MELLMEGLCSMKTPPPRVSAGLSPSVPQLSLEDVLWFDVLTPSDEAPPPPHILLEVLDVCLC